MQAHNALIAWSPWDSSLPSGGQIEIGTFDSADTVPVWTLPYSFVLPTGIAYRAMRGDASVKALFVDFQYLVVEERLDPEAVHKAFLAVDEYCLLFGPGMDAVGQRN